MTLLSIGDLAQDFALRRQTATLTREMARLTGEVSTGQTTDVARQLGGQLGLLLSQEFSRLLGGFRSARRGGSLNARVRIIKHS